MFLTPCYNIGVKKLKKTSRRRLARLAFFAISAILLTIFLEYRYYIHVWEYTWRFVFGSPLAFLFNAYLMMLALYVIWACVRRPAATVGLMWTFLAILTYVHINKYNSRGTPILPEDFQLASQASALSKFVDVGSVVRMVLAIALAWILFLLLGRIVQRQSEKWFGRETVRRRLLTERAVTLVIATLLLICSTDFARHTDGQRYTPNFLGTHFTAWNQNRNYSDNGFILGFLYNLQKLQLTEPAGYSEEMISEAKTRYAAIAEAENRERVSAADEDVSFVIVLNESLFDPTVEFQGLKFQEYYPHSGGDIMPNLHNLERKYPHGLMYSLDYGGGTANIEFETLTGMTNYWVNTVPYTSLIPRAGEIPSIARTFAEKGYATTAIHPYNSGMYKRNIALANEGFQGFISEIKTMAVAIVPGLDAMVERIVAKVAARQEEKAGKELDLAAVRKALEPYEDAIDRLYEARSEQQRGYSRAVFAAQYARDHKDYAEKKAAAEQLESAISKLAEEIRMRESFRKNLLECRQRVSDAGLISAPSQAA